MDYKKKGFGVGAATALVGIETYWIAQAIADYTEMECVIAAVIIAGLVSLCVEVVWRREQERKYKRHTKRVVDKAIKRFMAETERDYLIIPRKCEEVHMHRRWESEDEPEKKEPIREVKGALAEDFAKAPESVRKEIFG